MTPQRNTWLINLLKCNWKKIFTFVIRRSCCNDIGCWLPCGHRRKVWYCIICSLSSLGDSGKKTCWLLMTARHLEDCIYEHKRFYSISFFWIKQKTPKQGKRHKPANNARSKARTENLETLLLPMTFINPFLAPTLYYFCHGQVLSFQLRPQLCCAEHCIQSWRGAPLPFCLLEIQKLNRDIDLPHVTQLSLTMLISPKCLTDACLLACHGLRGL